MGWADAVVEIRVARGPDVAVGTGFHVEAGKILTARHVLASPAGVLLPARVRWDAFPEFAGGDGDGLVRAAALWHDAGLDLALLDVPAPPAAETLALARRDPVEGEAAHSRGYPAGARINGRRAAFAVSGTVHAPARHETTFPFDVGVGGADPHDWGGLSGAPVVAADGTAIGVLVEARRAMGVARTLPAVPSRRVLGDPGYAAALTAAFEGLAAIARGSVVLAELAGGRLPERVRARHGHKAFFAREVRELERRGLVATGTDGPALTVLGRSVAARVAGSGGFRHLT